MISCTRCSGENKKNAKFCRHCGKPMGEKDYALSTKLPLGTILDDRYKIIDYIAKGGMGAIYKAIDIQSPGIWAVKEMLDYFDSEKEREYAVGRFITEAQILYDLDHDSIPKFVDCFISENRYYLIMEFIYGVDLRTMLDEAMGAGKQGIDEEIAVNWAVQICDVLNYLHNQDPSIIYRDLKPGNIMVNNENKIFLVDFGIARLFDPRTKGTMVGTQGYAPPEQYRGEAEPRSDQYSLAACLHHLLTGKDPRNDVPFNFPSVRSLRSDLTPKIELILDKALCLDINKRFRTIGQTKEALLSEDFPPPYTHLDLSAAEYISMGKLNALPPKKSDRSLLFKTAEYIVSTDEQISSDEFVPKLSGWHMFRSNRKHSGKSQFCKDAQGNVIWKFNTGARIRSSPVIAADGTVYFGADNGMLYAVSREGLQLWTYKTNARIISSPAIDKDGNIYVGSNDCYVHAIKRNGEPLWKFKTYGRVRSSPCIGDDSTIYAGSYDHYLYAIRPDGKLKWRLELNGHIESTPAVLDDERIYIISKSPFEGKSCIYCIDSKGDVIWRTKIETQVKSSPCLIDNGIMYFGAMDGNLYSFNPDGILKWKFHTGASIVSSPVLNGDHEIVFGSLDKNVYSVTSNGRKMWSCKTMSSVMSSPAISGDGGILIGSDDSNLYSIAEYGKIKWHVKAENKIRSSPAISEGNIIYVGSDDGYLYAIG